MGLEVSRLCRIFLPVKTSARHLGSELFYVQITSGN